MRRAFFMLQRPDVYSPLASELHNYSVIICNPDLDEKTMFRLRGLAPEAKLLAYDNCMDSPNEEWGSDYWKEKRRLIRPFLLGVTWWPGSPAYMLSETLSQRLAKFHWYRTLTKGFDGIYLDRCPRLFPEQQVLAGPYRSKWPYLRQYYTTALRSAMRDTILIANASGPLADPMLNGIGLEYIESKIPLVRALGMLMGAVDSAWADPFCIGWVRTTQEQEAVESLRGIPWMIYGEMKGVGGFKE